MAQTTAGIRSILSLPWVYNATQTIFGARKFRRYFVDEVLRLTPGMRILEIGCGPGGLVPYLPNGTAYVGYDLSADYIAAARARYGDRGEFVATPFTHADVGRHEPFDVAIAIALLHHLDDDEAITLLRLLKQVVGPSRRVVTADPVFVDGQNPVASQIIAWDRGRNIRRAGEYRALADGTFDRVEGEIVDKGSIPRLVRTWVMQCR